MARNEPRRHHYVPVFYQKLFANPEGLLWVYDRKLKTCKELPPEAICCEKDLYTIRPENAPSDRQIESKLLATVDGIGAAAIRELQSDRKLNPGVLAALNIFVAFQFTRLPSVGRAISAVYTRGAEETMRIMFANVERARTVLAEFQSDTGDSVDVSAESLVEAVQGKHIRASATEVPFLMNLIEQAVMLGRLIARLDWEILTAPAESGFITCDSPVVLVPPKGIEAVGFLVPGAVKYFPVSRELCLRLADPGHTFRYRKVDKENVRIINQNVAANSERFIMGPSKVQLETIIQRSSSAEMDATPRFTMETVEADQNSSLQKITFRPRRYFYSKNRSEEAP